MKKKILVTPSSLCTHVTLLDELSVFADLTYSSSKLPDDLSQFNAIILGNEILGKKEISCAKKLEIVVRYGVGIDNIDVEYLKKNDILLTNTRGAASRSVAEYTIASMFEVSKKISSVNRKLSKELESFIFEDLYCKSIGIIGLGSIGQQIAQISKAIGLNVFCFSRTLKEEICRKYDIRQCSLDYLLENSDFISLNVSLNNATENMIGKNEFTKMKNSAYLINTSRENVVDSLALYEALKNKSIAGAVLDVYPKDLDFHNLENVILTPHISSRTKKTTELKIDIVKEVLLNYFTQNKVSDKYTV